MLLGPELDITLAVEPVLSEEALRDGEADHQGLKETSQPPIALLIACIIPTAVSSRSSSPMRSTPTAPG